MRSWLFSFVTCTMIMGCSSEVQQQPADENRTVQSDPNDPMICTGDPDSIIICVPQSELWDCQSMPNGEIKCAHKEPQSPGGGGNWTCEQEEDKIICKTNSTGVTGGGDWTCSTDETGTTCEKKAFAPPGGGSYECGFADQEFTWACTKKAETPTGDGGVPLTEGGVPISPPVGQSEDICYDAVSDVELPVPPEGWWAKISAGRVLYNGEQAAHIKLYLSKAFVDNTYGNYSVGYAGGALIGGGHSFNDLVESDKMEIFLDDQKGNLLFHIAMDYISPSSSAPSGYASLGVSGGDGAMLTGDTSNVLAIQTSLAVNLNGHGYVLTENSPVTDINYTPDPNYPNWIFNVWYETWIKWSAFGDAGPAKIYITGLHASPNKTAIKKLQVVPVPCPP